MGRSGVSQQFIGLAAVVLAVAACGGSSEGRDTDAMAGDGDAPEAHVDATEAGVLPPDGEIDADAGKARACNILEPSRWSANSPFGAVDGELTHFNAGDCITISQARVELQTGDGSELSLRFSYPVSSDDGGRRSVEGAFEREAEVSWRPRSGSPEETTAEIQVEVERWVEHPSSPEGHEIDAAVWFRDARFGADAITVRGRFCDWLRLTC